MTGFEQIDHTADIGVRAFGRTLEELFRNAALGMFDLIADLSSVGTGKEASIQLTAEGVEDLYIMWHQELLFRSSVDHVVYKEFHLSEISDKALRATIRGEAFDPEKQILKKEVKAATYHGLKVHKKEDVWVGEVIFDI